MTAGMPLRPGALLGNRYQIGRLIGQGGMGAVYEVVDQRLNARVALKQIIRTSPALREAFEREAKLLANLRHQSLPIVSDYFSEADSDFIVMEYISGEDLAQIVQQQGALPIDQVVAWADQLLDVLSYLHTHEPPIIHRDIKPQNIKRTERGKLVLLDFGIAKGSAGVVSTTGQDHSVVAWTPHYASPEQFLREGTDARSDVYSVAATLYHLLSSQRPVAINERLARVRDEQPDPLQPVQKLNRRVPPALGDLIHRAMALKVSARPASAAAFRELLRGASDRAAAFQLAPEPTEVTEAPDSHKHVPDRKQDATEAQPGHRHERAEASMGSWPSRGAERASDVEATSRSAARGGQTLQKRIHALVHQVLDGYEGAWMVWCDPRGDWRPLLERVARDSRLGGFSLLTIADRTANEIGGLQARQEVQKRLDAGDSFVLLMPSGPNDLGWLWAQALRAERLYTRTLRDQLIEWGWRPHSPTITEDEIALLARQGLQQEPASWGGGGLQPDLPLLLEVLAGGAEADGDEAYILDLTIEQAGLPHYDAQAPARWRAKALARLLITQAHQVAPKLIGEAHELLISEGQRAVALDLLSRWSDSLRLSKRLPEAILEADKIAVLGSQPQDVTAKHGPFLSRAAEQAVFAQVCARLAQKVGKDLLQSLANLQADLARHADGYWGDRAGRSEPGWAVLVIPWGELLRLSRAAQTVLEVAPAQDWVAPQDALRWYTKGGWRLDVAGEEIVRNLTRSIPELLAVVAPLREAYRARWEKTLIQWSDIWTAAGCPTLALDTAGAWLTGLLTAPRATAILVVDALRYDIGATLAEWINAQEGAERALVQPARAPLPTITALGMGMALPMREADLRADVVDNQWRLTELASGTNLSSAEERRRWLRDRGIVPGDGMLTLAQALQGSIPAPAKGRTRLLITDDIIDQLGHDDELELLGSTIALERYRDVIIRLRDAGWRRILVVTDHGFIHWPGSDEKRVAPPVIGAVYRSRRALAYPASTDLPGAYVLSLGERWKILPARGASCWIAYGGLGYFHGGASLQEWVIPCVKIEWPQKAQPVTVALQPLEHVLSVRPRVIVRVERESMFIEDALPRHVEVIIRHRSQRTILFRSAQTEITPNQEQVAIALRLTPGADAAWDTPLRIEVRDALTEEVLTTTDSVLRARLDEW